MNANDFKEQLSVQDVYSLLLNLDANPILKNQNGVIHCVTICHGGDGHNLRYYADTFTFHCYSHCGTMSIYDVVGKALSLDFFESFKYVLSFFNYSLQSIDFKKKNYEDSIDLDFFDRSKKTEIKSLYKIDESCLNIYEDIYYKGWINEGISIKTMKKFNIKNSISDQQIIIPHYDEVGNLVGVRCRNLNEDLVSSGKKYMPVFNKGKLLNHPTGSVLYGLNFNKKNIEKHKKIILFESEKSVLQLDSMMPEMSIGVCLSGSNLTDYQVEILKALKVNEVIIALDKEFEKVGDSEEKFFAKKIETTFYSKLSAFFNVSVIWDVNGLLDKKDSPTDKGLKTFYQLFTNRIFLNQ